MRIDVATDTYEPDVNGVALTLERLVRIGEEAEAARAAIRSRDDGRLLTMHTYFDTVAGSRERGQSPVVR